MRILQWCEFYPPFRGGAETIVAQLAAGQQAAGHEILVLTGAGDGLPPVETSQGVEIRRFPFQETIANAAPLAMTRLLRDVRALKQTFRPELVHLHFMGPSCFFHLRTLDAVRAPTLVTIHSEFRNQDAGPDTLLRALLRQADWVTGVSQAMLDDAIALGAIPGDRASVVYNGVDPADQPAARRAPIPEIFCFGRHVWDKGLDIAIGAFALIKQRGQTARLVIGSDGPARPALEAQAARLGLGEAVRFAGWLDPSSLRRQIDRSRLVCIPSRWREGFGLAALEAALRARPVVATRVGGLPEVVSDGVTGLLVPPEAPGALADAIMSLLDEPAWARGLGLNAERRALERFSFAGMCANYQRIYEHLLCPR